MNSKPVIPNGMEVGVYKPYYYDYSLKPQKKKQTNSRRAYSKKPAARDFESQNILTDSMTYCKSPKESPKMKLGMKLPKNTTLPSNQSRNYPNRSSNKLVAGPSKSSLRKVSTVRSSEGYNLTDLEKSQYGNRMATGYKKLSLLGKGGCAIVWLAKHIETGAKVAVKQFPKKMDVSSGRVEALILQRIFENEIDSTEFPGINYIAKLLDTIEDKNDLWLIYELGGVTLTKNLFEVKGEFFKGQRVYHCNYQKFYYALKTKRKVMVDFMTKMLQVFELLSALDIVHADLKPDNILVDFDGEQIKDMKLIDFGSAFIFSNAKSISMSTPEYLSPEVLKFIDKRHSLGIEGAKAMFRKMNSWSYDAWSIGAIFLEIVTGFPLWLGLKGKITTRKGKNIVNFGIFGVRGRDNAKIINKQNTVLKDLPSCIKKYDSYSNECDEVLMDFLYGLLEKSPRKRMSPTEALAHPFITQEEA
ncbi:unnamed protein product [Moneuplotes crassus]|uniref:Protein kinase domain-containing protein n=2 Tax=Euplotes crassus TaxID=5936 RepID=A0AAD1U8W2_EUPCR|nr:unnamed protein product [Moneuplotes crassus]